MLKIAICDDEPAESGYLKRIVERWAELRGRRCAVSLFRSAEQLLFACEEEAPDILLLDIQMEGMSGVELARRLRREDRTFQLVFVTGFADFVLEGYEVAALHYLLKPVEEEKLYAVLDRAAAELRRRERTVLLPYEGGTLRLPVGQIVCVEAFLHAVELRTSERRYELRRSISEMEGVLGEGFVRCHRSYLVNLDYIRQIGRSELLLDTGERLPLSRGNYDRVNRAFIRHFRGGDDGTV